MHKPSTGVKYDEAAQNDYFAKFNRWYERNMEIYRSSFTVENSIYFHDFPTQIYQRLVIEDIIKECKEDITHLINQMQADIERSDFKDHPKNDNDKDGRQSLFDKMANSDEYHLYLVWK